MNTKSRCHARDAPMYNSVIGQYSHPGSECGLILQGELQITIRDKVYLHLRLGEYPPYF